MASGFNRKVLTQRRETLQFSRLDVIKRLYEIGRDISEGALRNWEEGHSEPEASDLPPLAEVLRCKVHEFYA